MPAPHDSAIFVRKGSRKQAPHPGRWQLECAIEHGATSVRSEPKKHRVSGVCEAFMLIVCRAARGCAKQLSRSLDPPRADIPAGVRFGASHQPDVDALQSFESQEAVVQTASERRHSTIKWSGGPSPTHPGIKTHTTANSSARRRVGSRMPFARKLRTEITAQPAARNASTDNQPIPPNNSQQGQPDDDLHHETKYRGNRNEMPRIPKSVDVTRPVSISPGTMNNVIAGGT